MYSGYVDAPGGIRTHDLRLRRRHRPALTNAGRCRFRHLRESRVDQRQPATAPLLPPLLPRGRFSVGVLEQRPPYVHQGVSSADANLECPVEADTEVWFRLDRLIGWPWAVPSAPIARATGPRNCVFVNCRFTPVRAQRYRLASA